ncbi:MAG: hypothetical protein GY871_04030 [Actinomycetales bacterium]|nr:hypothetical protein [Actinomycetales bacterium]
MSRNISALYTLIESELIRLENEFRRFIAEMICEERGLAEEGEIQKIISEQNAQVDALNGALAALEVLRK